MTEPASGLAAGRQSNLMARNSGQPNLRDDAAAQCSFGGEEVRGRSVAIVSDRLLRPEPVSAKLIAVPLSP